MLLSHVFRRGALMCGVVVLCSACLPKAKKEALGELVLSLSEAPQGAQVRLLFAGPLASEQTLATASLDHVRDLGGVPNTKKFVLSVPPGTFLMRFEVRDTSGILIKETRLDDTACPNRSVSAQENASTSIDIPLCDTNRHNSDEIAANAAKKVDAVSVFGDSFATGIFGASSISSSVSSPEGALRDPFLSRFVGDVWAWNLSGGQIRPSHDDLQSRYADSNRLSAWGGAPEWSLAQRLMRALDVSLPVRNHQAVGLSLSVARGMAAGNAFEGVNRPLVVVQFGGEEVCNGGTAQAFAQDYRAFLATIFAKVPGARVVAVPVQDLMKTALVAPADRVLPKLNAQQMTCRQARDVFAQCPALQGTLGDVAERVSAFNSAIRESVAASVTDHPGQIVMAESLAESELVNENSLAVDCLHLNLGGLQQSAVAGWLAAQAFFE